MTPYLPGGIIWLDASSFWNQTNEKSFKDFEEAAQIMQMYV